jgi:hypothetical protein
MTWDSKNFVNEITDSERRNLGASLYDKDSILSFFENISFSQEAVNP